MMATNEGRDRWVPGAQWPASLACLASSRQIRDPLSLKERKEKENSGGGWSLRSDS